MSAQVYFAVHNGRRSRKALIERVETQNFILGVTLNHKRGAVSAGDIDPVVRTHRRGKNTLNTVQPLLGKVCVARLRIKAGKNSVVAFQKIQNIPV